MKTRGILLSLLTALSLTMLASCGSDPDPTAPSISPSAATSSPSGTTTGTRKPTAATTVRGSETAEPTSPATMVLPSSSAVVSTPAMTTAGTTVPTSIPTVPSPTPTPVPLPAVETDPPNTAYAPAFPGQTRVAGVATSTPYDVTVLSQSLASPWAVAPLPDGRMVITEKAGSIRIAAVSGELSAPIGGFPVVDNRSQGGLLDVTAAPDFAATRMLYFTLAESTPAGSLTALGRGRLADDETTVEGFEILWRAIPYCDNSMHFGSRVVFAPDGNLFVSTGERSDLATRPKAQLLDNGYGKVVRLTPDGKPAPGNPFTGQPGVLPEIYSYGHRNAQGLAIHSVTGELWMSEMGPRGGDEINRIRSGRNYGWPVISYGIEYSGLPIPGGLTAQDGMEQPVYYWDPVIAPSGMTFYPYDTIPEWKNNLFVAGLRGQHIARLVIEGDRVVGEERLLASEGQRFRDVAAGPDGALYAVTDAGRLYRIG